MLFSATSDTALWLKQPCAAERLFLLKPTTFMNLSGNAVRYWLEKENIATEHLLVIVDDVALPIGQFRLKGKGSAGGHNGLKHIEQAYRCQLLPSSSGYRQ